MKSCTFILLFLFVLLSAGSYAQEQESNREQTEADVSQQDEKTQSAENDDGKNDISPDIRESFRPSEEISEDLSVSFPVDI